MTVHLSRRTLLGAAPTLAAPMALLPASIAEAAADPLPGLLAKRAQCEAAWLAIPSCDEETPAAKAAWSDFAAAEKAIETTVACTPEGVAAQIEYLKLSYREGPTSDPNPTSGDIPHAVLDVILAGLRRIAQ